MLEKKIYSPWAFSENEHTKCLINREIYQELKDKSKRCWFKNPATDEDLKTLFCYEANGSGYANVSYRILSNPNKLTNDQMALICDSGNLCFGYRMQGNSVIVIYTD